MSLLLQASFLNSRAPNQPRAMPRRDNFVFIAASAVAAVCFMSITAGFQRSDNGKIMSENNCNFSGNGCRSMKAIPAVCCDVCARDSTCTDWIWNNYNGGTCWFKNGTPLETNCVSGNAQAQVQAQIPKGALVRAETQVPTGARVQVQAGTQVPATAGTQVPATAGAQVPAGVPVPAGVQVPAGGHVPAGGQSIRVQVPAPQVQVPAKAQVPAGQASSNAGLSAAEMSKMLALINAYRAQNGLSALTLDNRLVASSALHSKDQASQCTMTHTSSNGSTLSSRIGAQGYDFAIVTENVAAGQSTVEDVMTSWWNSPGHRANLLDRDVVNVGFAKAVNTGCNRYTTYWTQDFGRLD